MNSLPRGREIHQLEFGADHARGLVHVFTPLASLLCLDESLCEIKIGMKYFCTPEIIVYSTSQDAVNQEDGELTLRTIDRLESYQLASRPYVLRDAGNDGKATLGGLRC